MAPVETVMRRGALDRQGHAWRWQLALPMLVLTLGGLGSVLAGREETQRDRLIAIFVIDGLRPDSINAADTPTLERLRAEGVEYVNSHSVFPTSTRINAASLATGAYPVLHGIVGNSMFVGRVSASGPFDTGDHRRLLELEAVEGRAATAQTLGEVLQRHGRTLVTASSGTTGNGFLLNPQARHGAGVAIHGLFGSDARAYPRTVSDAILERFGTPPPDPDDLGQMRWTDTVVREYVLPELRPDVMIDWMGPLDAAQHASGVGSRQAKDALRHVDESLSRTIAKIEALGLSQRFSIIITSDHGFARHGEGINVTQALIGAGLKESAASTDVIVASQGQSVLFYLPGGDSGRTLRLVQFLQRQPWVDLVFTRGGTGDQGSLPGTFSLDLIKASHPTRAADVAVSLAWSSNRNQFGVPGTHTINAGVTGPIAGEASGHGGLSPWVVRNTLVAWGADFKPRTRITAPASLADIMPTVLAALGIDGQACRQGCGRVLREALKDSSSRAAMRTARRTVRTRSGDYRASIQLSIVEDHRYVDSGSRER
jgi:predicted AlkP superfamily pyrophosphatase or phosphodiesterase